MLYVAWILIVLVFFSRFLNFISVFVFLPKVAILSLQYSNLLWARHWVWADGRTTPQTQLHADLYNKTKTGNRWIYSNRPATPKGQSTHTHAGSLPLLKQIVKLSCVDKRWVSAGQSWLSVFLQHTGGKMHFITWWLKYRIKHAGILYP